MMGFDKELTKFSFNYCQICNLKCSSDFNMNISTALKGAHFYILLNIDKPNINIKYSKLSISMFI